MTNQAILPLYSKAQTGSRVDNNCRVLFLLSCTYRSFTPALGVQVLDVLCLHQQQLLLRVFVGLGGPAAIEQGAKHQMWCYCTPGCGTRPSCCMYQRIHASSAVLADPPFMLAIQKYTCAGYLPLYMYAILCLRLLHSKVELIWVALLSFALQVLLQQTRRVNEQGCRYNQDCRYTRSAAK